MIVLSSHGDYAKSTLASCEIIAGKLSNIQAIAFHDPMGVDDVISNYQTLYDQKKEDEEFLIICDIPNGTPANAALLFQGNHPDAVIYGGLSFALILALATGTEIDTAIEQVNSLTGPIGTHNLIAHKSNQASRVDDNVEDSMSNTDNPLVNVRVDARLIHGQVATMWTRSVGATRIMIVDDGIVKSDIQKDTLKTAVPGGVHLSILTADGAAKRIKSGKYHGQRVFLIVRDPKMLTKLVNGGVDIKEINVGNLSMSKGAVQIARSVAVTSDDIQTFKNLNASGVKLYHQMVPNDKQEDLFNLIKERN